MSYTIRYHIGYHIGERWNNVVYYIYDVVIWIGMTIVLYDISYVISFGYWYIKYQKVRLET